MKKKSGRMSWPDWCYIPVAGSCAIAMAEDQNQGVDHREVGADIGNLAASIVGIGDEPVVPIVRIVK